MYYCTFLEFIAHIHNDVEMSLWLQPREDTLPQKICKTDLEEDSETFFGELFNRPLGDSQHGLDEQADKENPLKKMVKKMSK